MNDPYVVTIDYTNWRGERSLRRIKPIYDSMRYGTTEWHKECQWLFRAIDVEKGEEREFAMKDIHSWGKQGPAQTGAGLAENNQRLRELNEQLSSKVSSLTRLLDEHLGTPCEQIRHEQALARIAEAHGEAVEALRWIAGHPLGDANGSPNNRLDPLSGAACVNRARAVLANLDASQGTEGE